MKCPVCKKNISQTVLKCPYCKSRTGLLCSHCNTINPVGNLVCSKCGHELLKVCPNCNGINFPSAVKCRKCGTPFGKPVKKNKNKQNNALEYSPNLISHKKAVDILQSEILGTEKKVFSVSGEKGIGKTTILKAVMKKLEDKNLQWCFGYCTPITQITPGGVIHDMLLNIFNLPSFSSTFL